MAQIDLSQYGIKDVKNIIYNPSYDDLYRDELNPELKGYERGILTSNGAVDVFTGVYTGRSPKDKYLVRDEVTEDTVWWTSDGYKNDNKPITPKVWDRLKEEAVEELSDKTLYVVDCFCGANANTRICVRFIMENMPFFISPPYQVLMMTCSRCLMLKATTVSEWRPSSL